MRDLNPTKTGAISEVAQILARGILRRAQKAVTGITHSENPAGYPANEHTDRKRKGAKR